MLESVAGGRHRPRRFPQPGCLPERRRVTPLSSRISDTTVLTTPGRPPRTTAPIPAPTGPRPGGFPCPERLPIVSPSSPSPPPSSPPLRPRQARPSESGGGTDLRSGYRSLGVGWLGGGEGGIPSIAVGLTLTGYRACRHLRRRITGARSILMAELACRCLRSSTAVTSTLTARVCRHPGPQPKRVARSIPTAGRACRSPEPSPPGPLSRHASPPPRERGNRAPGRFRPSV